MTPRLSGLECKFFNILSPRDLIQRKQNQLNQKELVPCLIFSYIEREQFSLEYFNLASIKLFTDIHTDRAIHIKILPVPGTNSVLNSIEDG